MSCKSMTGLTACASALQHDWQVPLLQTSHTWCGLCLPQVQELVSHVRLEVTYLKR